MKPYLYMIKIKLLLSLNYRFEFYISLLVQVIFLFTSIFFWKAAYKGVGVVENVNEQQMLTYSVISLILSSIFITKVESTIQGKVRKGNIAVDYIKPTNIFLMYFSEDIGDVVTSIIQKAFPVFVFSFLFINPLPTSAVNLILFLLSSCLSYLILWLISAIIGLFYFRVIDMGPVGIIKDYLVRVLSGSFVPIWFFPKSVQAVLNYLPFIYTYQLPLSIYIGRSTINAAFKGMLVQVLWVLIFYFLFKRLKDKIEQNIFVQGG
ncbi:MAG: hypothetical protein A2Y15_08880 [Clostridiales bacterium GWF2_36_10]|nr:MAG: hypothetical protein A2Y15_08880 [Clostridiales bacterium GWF2_36_10]HAN20588.1 hypothetical protein [Clostridiales bacterium]